MSYDPHCPHWLGLHNAELFYEAEESRERAGHFAEYRPPESELDWAIRVRRWPFIYCIVCGFPLDNNDELCPRCNPSPQENRP